MAATVPSVIDSAMGGTFSVISAQDGNVVKIPLLPRGWAGAPKSRRLRDACPIPAAAKS